MPERRTTPGRAPRAAAPRVEPLEGRALAAAHPGGAVAHPALLARAELRQARHAAAVQAAAQAAQADAAKPVDRSLGRRVDFALDTVKTGRSMAYSSEVRNVGAHYASLTLAHDTRKVGAAYIRAALRGDGPTLKKLGDTRLVNKVGDDYTRLSHSGLVRRVGDHFTRFGRSVANQFNKLFG